MIPERAELIKQYLIKVIQLDDDNKITFNKSVLKDICELIYCLQSENELYIKKLKERQAEIERLNSCVKSEDEVRAIANATIQAGIKIIKAEAIKEFTERLKDILAIEVTVEYEIADGFFKDFFDITETFNEIDNLVKEMVGDAIE